MQNHIFLFFLFCTCNLQAENPFLGEWQHESGYALFNKIEVLSTRLAESQPIILFYNRGELFKRVGGTLNDKGVLTCSFKSGSREIDVQMAISEESSTLKAKIRMNGLRESASYIRQTKKATYAGSTIRDQGEKPNPTPMVLNGSKIEPKEPKEMELIPPKGTVKVQLEKCTNCKQYIVWLLGNGLQKPIQPNAEGQAKFTAIPFGNYSITVDWAGKVDRPDAPPYKNVKVNVEKSNGVPVKVPRK